MESKLIVILTMLSLLTVALAPPAAAAQDPVNADAGSAPPWAVEQQRLNLETAELLLERVDAADGAIDLAEAVELAKLGTRHQATTLGLERVEPADAHDHALPSQALVELAERHDAEMTREQVERVLALDDLPVDVRDALTRFVDAFLVMEDATAQAYGDVDLEALAGLQAELDAGDAAMAASSDDEAPWQSVLAEVGVDLAPVFPARNALLDATVTLQQALEDPEMATTSSLSPIVVAPAFAIDFAGSSDTYTQDVALSLDVGGDDTYDNNAGGAGLGAAALVDLGSGTENYGDGKDTVNGGGSLGGTGFLVDTGGSDSYSGDSSANGGGFAGSGFLLDTGGSDSYVAGDDSSGVNGGGSLGGNGFLLDTSGNDDYDAGWSNRGVNGGGSLGVGVLADTGGSDDYYEVGGSSSDSTVVPKGMVGAQLDLPVNFLGISTDTVWEMVPPINSVPISLPGADESASLPGVSTPPVATPPVTTPPVELPASCGLEPCRNETTLVPGQDHTVPGVPGQTVTTPDIPIPETCVPIVVCVGPFTVPGQSVGPTPGVNETPVHTDPVTLPPTCEGGGEVCTEPMEVLPSKTIDAPDVPGVDVTPAIGVSVAFTGVDGSVDPNIGSTGSIGPIDLSVDVPGVGTIPVTVCPDTCPAPVLPGLTADSELFVTVTVGQDTYSAGAPIHVDQ